jgi:hypothetical protein
LVFAGSEFRMRWESLAALGRRCAAS